MLETIGTEIFKATIGIVVIILATFATRALKAYLERTKQATETDARFGLRQFVAGLVRAAAQAVPEKSDRYAWVEERLKAKYPYLEPFDLDHLIEEAVHAFKVEMGFAEAAKAQGLAPKGIIVMASESKPPDVYPVPEAEFKARIEQNIVELQDQMTAIVGKLAIEPGDITRK